MCIQPKLEYAGIVWDTHTKTNSGKIEMVQYQAARWVLGCHHNTSNVTQMLQHLQGCSLTMRCIDTRLTFLYKMRNGLVGLDSSPYLQKTADAIGRAHPHHYYQLRLITRVASWGPDRRKWQFSEVRGGIWTPPPPPPPNSPVLISADKRPLNQLEVKNLSFSLIIKTFRYWHHNIVHEKPINLGVWMKEICTLLVKLHVIFSRMQRVNQHAS